MLSTMFMAQTNMINTTTITVDKNVDGKIIQEVFVIEGDGADEKLKELEKDQSVVQINVEKRVEMRTDDANSEEVKEMRKKVEAEIKDLENVTGKKAEKREENIEIEVTANDSQEIKKYKVKIVENGNEEVIEWNGEGEMPEKMKKVLGEHQAEIIMEDKSGSKKKKIKISKGMSGTDEVEIIEHDMDIVKEENNNRGQIGVMVSDEDGGVKVLSFLNDSMAKKAGLEEGDIITGINDVSIRSMRGLVEALTPYQPGDVVIVHFQRDDQNMEKKVTLGDRN